MSILESIRTAVYSAERSTKGWYRTNCPACVMRTGKEDRRWSMGFYPATGFYHCFKCSIHGTLKDDFSDLAAANPDESEDSVGPVSPPENFYPLSEEPALSSQAAKPAMSYMKSRNVFKSTWSACQIGVCVGGGDFNNRIVVPVVSQGVWLGYVGRVWDEEGVFLKYKNCENMKRGKMLWNMDALRNTTDEPVIIVEGLFDGLPHYPYTIACLGKPSHDQIPIILETERPIVVCLDGDAWYESEALCMRLAFEGKRASYIRLPPRTDPGNLKPGELLDMAYASLKSV